MNTKHTGEVSNSNAVEGASVGRNSAIDETAKATGQYVYQHLKPYDHLRGSYVALRDHVDSIKKQAKRGAIAQALLFARFGCKSYQSVITDIEQRMKAMTFVTDEGLFSNLVTTVGKNDTLDKYLAGSAYTATWYLGLISSVGYSTIVVGDTMASHAGWTEAGIANAPTYSQGARPTAAWSAASAGSKSLSSVSVFSITSAGTVKGCFLNSVATKDGTTGILYSAGLFSGGDRVVANGDTLNVSYTASQ